MKTFFTETDHYKIEYRPELHPFLKPFFKEASKDELMNIYGKWIKYFELTTDPEEADFFVLPMSWNFYCGKRKSVVLNFIEKVKTYNKPIFAWVSGNFGVEPMDKDVITFRPSGYQSKISGNELGMPIFFRDPLYRWFNLIKPILRKRMEKPVIGFCGYTSNNPLKWMKQSMYTVIRNSMYYLGSRYEQRQTLQSPLFLRNKVLRTLIKSDKVYTNFIFRSKYRARAIKQVDRLRTTGKYFKNIFDSDYVVCVRGGGNFSVRFYETLAMGRIPILIDTDCILPFDGIINWDQHIVRIRPEEFNQIDILVKNFHSNLTNKAFKEIQQKNRELWLTHLSTQFWSKVMKYDVERKNCEVINN